MMLKEHITRHQMAQPLTDGEIEWALEKWMHHASDDEDWLVVRALSELARIRNASATAAARQAEADLLAARAECDDDVDTCFIGVCG